MQKKTHDENILDDLRALLLAGMTKNQEEICLALEKKGHEVNQSKASRLLHKVGAVKAKNELGEIVYRLPKEPAPATPDSKLASLVMEIVSNEVMVVVNTSPGSASLIARLLDYQRDSSTILSTVAGDDVILVIPRSTKHTAQTLQEVKAMLS